MHVQVQGAAAVYQELLEHLLADSGCYKPNTPLSVSGFCRGEVLTSQQMRT